MSRILIRVLFQILCTKTKTERRFTIERSGSGIYLISLYLTSALCLFWCKEFWIITLIILLIVYILRKSKHLILFNSATNKKKVCMATRKTFPEIPPEILQQNANICCRQQGPSSLAFKFLFFLLPHRTQRFASTGEYDLNCI